MRRLKNFIDGKWVESSTTEFEKVYNPARGEVLCEVPLSTRE